MIVFILLWVITVTVIVSNPKNPTQLWLGATVFLAGLGGIHFLILENAYHWFSNYPLLCFFENLIIYASSLFLFPYAFLMFASYYYTDLNEQWKRWRKPLGLILLLPVVLTYGIFPFWSSDFYHIIPYIIFVDLWIVPYFLVANFLLISSYFRVRSRRQRNNSFMTCIIITPISLLDLITGYILPGFGIISINLNPFLMIILFLSFSGVVTRYGALGVKLRIEKFQLDNAIKTMTSGAAILNHSIKNEIAKISMCASNLNSVGQKPAHTIESAQIVLRSTGHILKMIERTQQYTQDLTLEKVSINLTNFLEEILLEFQHQFLKKNIEVITNFGLDNLLTADPLHLREVISNVIKNALEALESGGKLVLKVTKYGGMVTISVKDTGIGIPAELLPHIFEPFFTTKNPKINFGLGLLYCYQILKKHRGTLEIESEPDKGTTVYLTLPRYKINRFQLLKGASYVQNKSVSG